MDGMGWMDGWVGLDLRVGGGIEHLTVLIRRTRANVLCVPLFSRRVTKSAESGSWYFKERCAGIQIL